ncbi:MAG: DNA repair protein RadC [Tissierellia bacterium]|nr:DNA repair protein RadC [Tissierellia bacterium]
MDNKNNNCYKRIHDLSIEKRPREKLQKLGSNSLSNQELLAILIGNGYKNKNAIELSEDILNTFSDIELQEATVEELMRVKGIGLSKASVIVAALQLGKRITNNILNKQITVIKSSLDVYNLMKDEFSISDKEHFIVILLNSKNDIISRELVSVGDLNSTIANPREIFKPAVKKSANSIILCHNHPSGDPTPSLNDKMLTKRLTEAGEILGIQVLDHIIIGQNKYFSIIENRMFLGENNE